MSNNDNQVISRLYILAHQIIITTSSRRFGDIIRFVDSDRRKLIDGSLDKFLEKAIPSLKENDILKRVLMLFNEAEFMIDTEEFRFLILFVYLETLANKVDVQPIFDDNAKISKIVLNSVYIKRDRKRKN